VSDFILENEIEARVGTLGNATKHRRWIFQNVSTRQIDFGSFSVWFETTDRHIHSFEATDNLDRTIRCEPTLRPEGYLRVTCYFQKVLEPGARYVVDVGYEQPHYFMHMADSDCWLVDEWFARERVDLNPYVQQEPEKWSYALHIPDQRSPVLGSVKNPLKALRVETNPPDLVETDSSGAWVKWTKSLDVGERSEKLYVLYGLKWRPAVATLGGGIVVGAAGTGVWAGVQAIVHW